MDNEKNFILKEIDVDREHLSSMVMETEEGTKKVKEKFFEEAREKRNSYIDVEIRKFTSYRDVVLKMLKERALSIFPNDSVSAYESITNHLSLLQNVVVQTNKYVDTNYKLGFSFLLEDINDNTSLLTLNSHLKVFISKFKEIGVDLKLEDFKYTMFTEAYMKEFLESLTLEDVEFSNKMRGVFDNIYWECPTIIYQIKLNLISLLEKYKKELNLYLEAKIDKTLQEVSCDRNNIMDEYSRKRTEAGITFARDEYANLEVFLNNAKNIEDYLSNSGIREKNYDTFCTGEFKNLSEEDKNKFDYAMSDFYNTLVVLKKYYKYEPIIKDLLKKYKEKDKIKTEYQNNEKTIQTENKNRLKIMSEYTRACGIGLFAKYNSDKIKSTKVKMNEEINKIKELYNKKNTYEVSINLDKYITESSTLYDLFMVCASSFDYLVSQLKNIFKDDEDFNLTAEVNTFYRFIFNPSNVFLRKSSCFSELKIESIISEKYRLLGLNIDDKSVTKDTIDVTMETVQYINLIQNIGKGKLSIENIAFICNVNNIEKLTNEDEVEMI